VDVTIEWGVSPLAPPDNFYGNCSNRFGAFQSFWCVIQARRIDIAALLLLIKYTLTKMVDLQMQ